MAMFCQHRIALAHLIPADVLWSFAPHSPFTSPEDNQIPRCEGLIVVLLPPIALCISPSRKQCQCSVRNVPRTATLLRSPLGADGAPVVVRRKQGRTIIIEHVRSWRCSNASGGASLGVAVVAAGCASGEAGDGRSTMLMRNAHFVVVVVVRRASCCCCVGNIFLDLRAQRKSDSGLRAQKKSDAGRGLTSSMGPTRGRHP